MPKKRKLVKAIAKRDIRIFELQKDIETLIMSPFSIEADEIRGRFHVDRLLEKALWFGTANIPRL